MKHLALISVIISWFSLGYLIHRYPNEKSFSISRHAASNRKAYLTMAVFEMIYLPMFLIFLLFWFAPHFHLSAWFEMLSVLCVAGLMIAAWVPDTDGWKNKVHEICAYGAATLAIPIMGILVFSQAISGPARIISFIAFVYMFTTCLMLAFWSKARDLHLPLQVIFFFVFHCAILSATYLR